MRHRNAQRKLNVWSSYRKMLLRNLGTSLVLNGKIVTTEARAKELRRQIDWIMTRAKDQTLEAKRGVYAFFTSKEAAKRCIDEAPKKFGDKTGGYTRQFKLGERRGDCAKLVLVKLDYE